MQEDSINQLRNLKIESLTARDLRTRIEEPGFFETDVIPISRHRAESQLLNPDLEETDVILNIARDERGRIIGFSGALPARLDKKERFSWNSGWWVDPERGRHAAIPLFYKFLEQCDLKALFSDLTPHTFEILGNMSFIRTFHREGVRIYYRSAFSWLLPERRKAYQKIRLLLNILDFLVNIPVVIYRASWFLFHNNDDRRFREVSEIDSETEILIKGSRVHGAIPRGKKHLEWIRNHPWILRRKPDRQEGSYPFSAYDKGFRQSWIRMDEDEVPKAFIIVNLHNRHMTVPYIYLASDDFFPGIADHLNRLAARSGASMLSSWHPGLSTALRKSGGPSVYRKTVLRYGGITEKMQAILKVNPFLYDGDGDAAFT